MQLASDRIGQPRSSRGASSERPASHAGTRIYYLHPLAAGPIDAWERYIADAASLGFSHILLAPPFLPGRTGNIFLTKDYNVLHPLLGGGDATRALAHTAGIAKRHGLGLMLDLVIDRVADNSPIASTPSEDLPDPRQPVVWRGAAVTDLTPEHLHFWHDLIGCWRQAGICGFRCETGGPAPADAWSRIIATARAQDPGLTFISWTPDTALAACDFDLAACTSWKWDFRADWLDEDIRRASMVADVLAVPEPLFGRRIEDPASAHRSLAFASVLGSAWLMPMGFEHGATEPLDPYRPTSIIGPGTRADAVLEANHQHQDIATQPPAEVQSAPGAPVAVLRRGPAVTIVANAHLDRSVAFDGKVPDLPPGGVAVLATKQEPPIVTAASRADAQDATKESPIAIESISPSIESGRFPCKRIVGDWVEVEVDLISEGHEKLAGRLLWRPADTAAWYAEPLRPIANDRWGARFQVSRVGRYLFTIEAWRDTFGTLQDDLKKKQAAGVDIAADIADGRALLARHAPDCAAAIDANELAVLLDGATAAAVDASGYRPFLVRHDPPLVVEAGRTEEEFASWYELFPRSQSGDPDRHGTFDDVIRRLPAIRQMGFDVLYMPPIHPIGLTNRKGRNNALTAAPDDPGSPYAIGGAEGGHDAIHPELGSFDDFRRLIEAAAAQGIEVALDFAIQCSPDHPWLREHPGWFAWRADGSLRYAENPPKKYEDIVNVDFYAADAVPDLWHALRDVVEFWIDHGVHIFRVDNPHTKPLPFWEWLIGDIRARHPDTIFLSEAFTRPKMMNRLAKVGFSQSYTYFTWRNSAQEIRDYLTELTSGPAREFFRPHFFVNTPDINPVFLQASGRAGFLIRAALAATLSGLWGIYSGFELCEADALPGREEYANSEKYEIRAWDWNRPGNIIAEITRLNAIRRANPALHSHLALTFLETSDPNVLAFAKSAPGNVVVTAVSVDPWALHESDIVVPALLWDETSDLDLIGTDLMSGHDFPWRTGRSRIGLDPERLPFLIWRLRPAGDA